jgi:CRISPR-associated protein Csa3
MTIYLSPIGYDSTRVTRPILSRGLDAGDEVILLLPETSKDDQQAADAVADVRRLLQEIEPDVGLSEKYLPHDDLQQSVFICTDLIQSIEQVSSQTSAEAPATSIWPSPSRS